MHKTDDKVTYKGVLQVGTRKELLESVSGGTLGLANRLDSESSTQAERLKPEFGKLKDDPHGLLTGIHPYEPMFAQKNKRPNTVILVSGYKRAGKDHISGILHDKLPNSVIYSLATPLKDIIATTLNIPLADLDEAKNCGEVLHDSFGGFEVSFRGLLQRFGSEAMKKWFGPDVWSDLFIKENFKQNYIIIADWRFKTEYATVCEHYDNVYTIRVNDDNIKNVDMHISETGLDDFNFGYIIDNTKKDTSVSQSILSFINTIRP